MVYLDCVRMLLDDYLAIIDNGDPVVLEDAMDKEIHGMDDSEMEGDTDDEMDDDTTHSDNHLYN
jgi:hypothetical protein